MKTYEKMLKEGLAKVPEKIIKDVRLEIPKPQSRVEGNRTFIINFGEIANTIRREPKHLAKFLFRELAKPGYVDGDRLILQGKVQNYLIVDKINGYCKEFLYCKECGKPDTQIVKEDRLRFLKCEACGSKSALRKI